MGVLGLLGGGFWGNNEPLLWPASIRRWHHPPADFSAGEGAEEGGGEGRGEGPLGLLELGQQKGRTFKAGLKHVGP